MAEQREQTWPFYGCFGAHNIEPREEKTRNNSLVNFAKQGPPKKEKAPAIAKDEGDNCEHLTATYWG